MRTSIVVLTCLGLGLLGGCASDPIEGRRGTTSSLNATSSTLWPVARGIATIPVCWAEPQLTPNRFPVPSLGPGAGDLEEHKAWVRAIAEEQWNARTPVHFVGWKPCKGSRTDVVQLVPIDSLTATDFGAPGQSAAEGIGTLVRGKKTFLNLSFGDEFLYSSRYRESAGANHQKELDLAERPGGGLYWLPSACLDELRNTWTSGSTEPDLARDVRDPAVLAEAEGIIKRCIQFNALHELGHVAGFVHEQYRVDDEPARTACNEVVASRKIGDSDLASIPPESRGDRPLGPFESESIMSYCRLDKTPTLTAQDVEMTRLAYSGVESSGIFGPATNGQDGQDGQDGQGLFGGIGGKGGKGGRGE